MREEHTLRTSWISLTLRSFALLIISICAAPITKGEKGALAGGALGAGTGVIIGNQVGYQGIGGGLIGDQMYGQSARQHDMTY